jgi:hypothetical protein
MFGLTDTHFEVIAMRHKENIARGEARAKLAQAIASSPEPRVDRKSAPTTRWARIASLIRAPIGSLPAGS